MLDLPKDVEYSVPELQYSLSRHVSNTRTGDDLPFSVTTGVGRDGFYALRVYLRRLTVYPDVVSNHA